MTRARLRDLGIAIGRFPTGPHNAITDVPGVWVGQTTLVYDAPGCARTGVTVVAPREGNIWRDSAFAGFHSFNGAGEMTGMHWLAESGQLYYPIALTATHSVGVVHEAIVAYGREHGQIDRFALPVVGETWDGWLNDQDGNHVHREHVHAALDAAATGPVAEGNTGGGTGMIGYEFKGGTGTASRVVATKSGRFTLGALVQVNHGSRIDLRVDGVPVGRLLGPDRVPSPWSTPAQGGSILVVLATDAPLLPDQCRRLARRAAVGLARTGGVGHHTSGDLFLAFATGNHLPAGDEGPVNLQMVPGHHLNALFEALAELVEEAILNALTAAETLTGYQGRTAHALPLDELQRLLAAYRAPERD
jgi:D-aminopeptidase